MQFVINTPSGNIGRALSHLLLDAGAGLTVIARSPSKVADLAARGARVVEGSLEDEAVLREAFKGANGVFWLNAPNLSPRFIEWSREAAERAAAVAKEAGVTHAVVVSSVGAHSGPGVGPVSSLLGVEDAFRAAIPNTVALRAAFFFENLLRDIGTIKGMGALFAPFPGDYPVPMVATRDIAGRAASYLLSGWAGHVITGVHGPRDLSQNEVARLIGEALGRPVNYVQVSLEQVQQGMLGAGLPEFVANLYTEMYDGALKGLMTPAEPRTPETTTTTALSAWLKEVFVPAFNA